MIITMKTTTPPGSVGAIRMIIAVAGGGTPIAVEVAVGVVVAAAAVVSRREQI